MTAPHAVPARDKTPSQHDLWLGALVDYSRPWYAQNGVLLPHLVHVSAGWGHTPRHAESGAIQSHLVSGISTEDGAPQVFISPVLAGSPVLARNLHHQLVHAVHDPDTRHGAEFRDSCRRIGLEGDPRLPVLGPELAAQLEEFEALHGPYPAPPMGTLVAPVVGTAAVQQRTRWLSAYCPTCPGHRAKHRTVQVARLTAQDGPPICGRILNPEEPAELWRRCMHIMTIEW